MLSLIRYGGLVPDMHVSRRTLTDAQPGAVLAFSPMQWLANGDDPETCTRRSVYHQQLRRGVEGFE